MATQAYTQGSAPSFQFEPDLTSHPDTSYDQSLFATPQQTSYNLYDAEPDESRNPGIIIPHLPPSSPASAIYDPQPQPFPDVSSRDLDPSDTQMSYEPIGFQLNDKSPDQYQQNDNSAFSLDLYDEMELQAALDEMEKEQLSKLNEPPPGYSTTWSQKTPLDEISGNMDVLQNSMLGFLIDNPRQAARIGGMIQLSQEVKDQITNLRNSMYPTQWDEKFSLQDGNETNNSQVYLEEGQKLDYDLSSFNSQIQPSTPKNVFEMEATSVNSIVDTNNQIMSPTAETAYNSMFLSPTSAVRSEAPSPSTMTGSRSEMTSDYAPSKRRSQALSASSAGVKKRRNRPIVACSTCRSRKVKCTKGPPGTSCVRCTKGSIACSHTSNMTRS
ncbi:hypothetical protein TREMEDRAFT_61610 [Tremella mesenterica DSM 1558]|nr:uncharacterized protein TREMEDRAFT_61610 [Tremella mesenterica DSM 1558]EIW69840.1 hypothetical protein TREMEDRAFT_61610 [Tremella mesenterica DSM 1558]